MTEYTINDIYQGGTSSFSPSYGEAFTGYHVPAGELGASTGVQTANQIQQVNMLLNQGIIPIEAGVLSPEVFDQIPKQHFKEINRMAKLTGAKMSVHAPIIEASGITQQGWNEAQRQMAEEQLKAVIDKTMPFNEKQGASITIHGAGQIPGTEYLMTPEGKKVERVFVVNRETGKLTSAFEEEEKFYPGVMEPEKAKTITPDEQINMLNRTEWDNSISQLLHHKVDADRKIQENISSVPEEVLKDIKKDPSKLRLLDQSKLEAYYGLKVGEQFLKDADQVVNGLYNKAYKFGTDEDKENLRDLSNIYGAMIHEAGINPMKQSQAMDFLIENIKKLRPEIYQKVDDFALNKSADTFSNVALHALNKARKEKMNAPMINIENFLPGMAFSDADSLTKLIKTSREKFKEKAIKQGFSSSEAEAQANKIIGATLDVGHLNIYRKKGYSDKDIAKEAAEIAKFVKHVHLTDNFGYSDSHLPPGMGNVPIKEIMESLGKEGFKGSKIVEAGGFVQQFGTSPFPYALQAMGGAIYTGGPTWQQTGGLSAGYSGGFGMMLPQANYQTFGAKFSQLPLELGGNISGQGSRMSGKPME